MCRVALIVTQQVRKSRSIHSTFDKFRVLFLFGSLAEFMGPFWFGQVSKSMVERDFNRFERPEAIGFSEGQFQTVVETLNDTAGNSLLARNQFSSSGRCLRNMRATFFIGSMRERRARVHQRSKNFPAQEGER